MATPASQAANAAIDMSYKDFEKADRIGSPGTTYNATESGTTPGAGDASARPAIDDLYVEVPDTQTANPNITSGAEDAETKLADTTGYESVGYESEGYRGTGYEAAQVQPTSRITDIMDEVIGSNSPIMSRARQSGMSTANRRGLINSSIAAGAAEAAVVDRATPLVQEQFRADTEIAIENARAEQMARRDTSQALNRSEEFNAGSANQAAEFSAVAEGRAREFYASAQNIASLQESEAWNKASSQNAFLGTEIAKANADRIANIDMFNAAQRNQIIADTLQMNAEFNRQYLAGEQALTLADLQGRYQVLVSRNEAAANILNAAMSASSQILANNKINATTAAARIQVIQQQADNMLNILEYISGGGGEEGGSAAAPLAPPPEVSTGVPTEAEWRRQLDNIVRGVGV